MKCKYCGKKFFEDIIYSGGIIKGYRRCRNCGTINFLGYRKYKFKNGVIEYED